MNELSKNELRFIQGGYESYWVMCTRALGYAVSEIEDAIEAVGDGIGDGIENLGHNAASGGCKL